MKLVCLIGKSGSGKNTILNKVLEKYPNDFHRVVNTTTRPPRENEQDGIDYHFINKEEFAKRVLTGDMIEASQFGDQFYGTDFKELSLDKVNIGIFNPQSIYCLAEDKSIETDIYYIKASDKNRLLRQLDREENPDIGEIMRRYKTDEIDFEDIEDIKYITLENNCLESLNTIAKTIWITSALDPEELRFFGNTSLGGFNSK